MRGSSGRVQDRDRGFALKELAKRGSLIRQDKEWLILDPPPEPRVVELEPPQLIDAPRRGSSWRPPADSEPSGGRLALLEAELARVRDKYAPGGALAQDLADNARQLRARTHVLVFDAHLLTDIKHQERTATAFATDPRRARLAGRGEKEGRAT